MNINRHNYETFFLLYVDNELSAAERKSVELFVQENADLGPELLSLLQVTLSSEPVSFNAKELLYKNEVDEKALQEKLLLHLDNELDRNAAKEMEEAIVSDNSLQHEWKILLQTKLDANEKIIFEDKQSLYRYERDRVVSMRFWRVAAAAIILFLCLYTGITLLKKDNAVENKTATNSGKPSADKQNTNEKASNEDAVDPSQTGVKENIASVKPGTQDKTTSAPVTRNNTINKKEIISIDKLVKKEKNILPKASLENINKDGSNEIIASAVLDKKNGSVIKNKIPSEIVSVSVKDKIMAPSAPVIDYNSIPAKSDSYAKTAVFNETPENNDKILYMNEENVSRSKIGGLFRRVKRVIERNTNIKTGNSVKIAGLEIAVK